MTPEVLAWCESVITHLDVTGRDVLEVGSQDVNGSIRPYVEALRPHTYFGVDLQNGPGVDECVPAERLVDYLGRDCYHLVISTEMLEHAKDWRAAVWNMMVVTEPGGVMVVTTRSPGFPRHDWPGDYWRFALEDFYWVWAGWYMEDLRPDPFNPGVFIRARKPMDWDSEEAWKRLQRLNVMEAPIAEG